MPPIDYGPIVWCDFAEKESFTSRPGISADNPDNNAPYFCYYCGATDHKEIWP